MNDVVLQGVGYAAQNNCEASAVACRLAAKEKPCARRAEGLRKPLVSAERELALSLANQPPAGHAETQHVFCGIPDSLQYGHSDHPPPA